jgi:membrane fusion protein (multidrug efflux system)
MTVHGMRSNSLGIAACVLLAGAGCGAGCSRAAAPASREAGQPHNSATFSPAAAPGAAASPRRAAVLAGAPPAAPATAGTPPIAPTPPTAGRGADLATRRAGFVGVVLARQAVTVAAEADGRLASVAVRSGDAVRSGQELAALSTEDVHEELIVVQATVSAARSEQRRAELELDRAHDRRARRELHPELYPEEELASARNAEQEAVASLDSAKARVAEEIGHQKQLETRLQHTVLRAPIDGRVALRYLDAGALVHSGTPVVRLISANDFMLRFAVPPEQAGAIRQGQGVEVRLDSLSLVLAGRVSRVTPRIDPASQMIFVEADLEVPGDWAGRLQDGLPGRVTVHG